MNGMFSLAGRVALVTGASRGLGLAMAEGMAAAGATVVLNGRHVDSLRAAAEQVRATGGATDIAVFDVADEKAAVAAVGEIARRHGRIDILVNNAGIVSRAPLGESKTADWQRVIDVNLTALYVLAREAARTMIERRWGRIVNVGSIMSLIGRATIPSYVAAKHGVAGLTKSLAAELGQHGITANAIAPGYFTTEINTALKENPDFDRLIVSRTPLRRWGEPKELAGAAVFLASDAASYVNGHVLVVDGGMTTTLL
jgi:gluconate 5-dehydrogenase